jgi:hypothetical protein
MSTRARMVHRCTISRNMAAGLDAYGNEQAADYGEHVASQPVYYYQSSRFKGGEQVGQINALVYVHQLLAPLSADITEADRITDIRDRVGHSLTAEVFNVTDITRKPDHKLVTMQAVS